MKKLMTVFVLGLVVTTLTGCGSKKLTCSRTEDGEESKMTFTFKSEKASTIKRSKTIEFKTEEEAKESKSTMESSLGNGNKPEYIDYEITVDGKKVTLLLIYDVAKMSDQDIEQQFGDELGTLSYDDIKTKGEASGFSCE